MATKFKVTIYKMGLYDVKEETDINKAAAHVTENINAGMLDEAVIDVLHEGADVKFSCKDKGCIDFVFVNITQN